MKLTRCERGHYFDAQLHSRCPSCGVPGLDTPQTSTTTPPPEPMITHVRGQPAPVADIGATVAMVRKKMGIDPVVGWLVCVEGPEKGRDYRIRSERNGIGRGSDMAISIQGDEAISEKIMPTSASIPVKPVFESPPVTVEA